MKAEKFFTHPLGIILAASGATFLWGSSFPFIKLSYAELDIGQGETFEQILFAGYRFILASLLILLFMRFIGRSARLKKSTIPQLTRVGLFQTLLQYLFFYVGLSYSTGIQGSIIAGTTSFFQIIIAHFLYQNDHLNWRKVTGLIIGFSGVVMVSLTKGSYHFSFGIGEICLLIAMFCGAMGNILAKNEAARLDILYMTSYQMLLGGIGLTLAGGIVAGFLPFPITGFAVLVLLYLSFLSAAAFVLWNNVMKYNKVGHISMYLFLIPVFGVTLSAAILGEPLHELVLLALALVVAGIVIVNRPHAEKTVKLKREARS
ncbi:DMT family transporter [Ammoniphilus sp. CFH 90114]|uniref:DMT family transporter n=1 Tax=Ammoniphilus sp. CFH 90114 TaxID=2493665 RepID=UPI00100F3895|nr:DMT family transporter [Ammoniphilus sp. CFH 90114]RXT04158.1 DMT family transporter [Ammoniphilus sp. CFH 90114]